MKRNISSPLSLAQVKSIQLEILEEINSFCHRESLTYFLAYGTALGAIRHKGYIPWDDDIDLIMPRPDYDRFVATYHSEENEVYDLTKSPLFVEMFAKVSRKGTCAEKLNRRSQWGVFVDVYPIDALPNNDGALYYQRMLNLNNYIPIVCPYYKTRLNKRCAWLLKYFAKRLMHLNLPSISIIKEKINNELRSNTWGSTTKSGVYFGETGLKEFMDTKIFREHIYVEFEGKKYPIPKNYDIYLTQLYGDYMKLPPVSERIPRHDYTFYWI